LVADPAFTGVAVLVFAVRMVAVPSVAVTVHPASVAVLNVTLYVFVPATRGALAGKVALVSLDEDMVME
jgi:hypothetical protein